RCASPRRHAVRHGSSDDAVWRQGQDMKKHVTKPRMRRRVLTAAALVVSFALAGCDSFDPLDKLSELDIMGTSKKPLQGERRPVFESGVAGVPQGVPPERVKGYHPLPDDAPTVI